jgi:hypothetical protein
MDISITEYFFKVHQPDGIASPAGASMRSGRALARTAVVRGGSTSMRTAIFRSPRGACNSQECSTLSIRFNLGENCYNVRSSSARSHPMWAGTPGFVEQSSHAGGDARTPPLTLFNGRTVTPCGRGRPRTQDARGSIILPIAIILISIRPQSPHAGGDARAPRMHVGQSFCPSL